MRRKREKINFRENGGYSPIPTEDAESGERKKERKIRRKKEKRKKEGKKKRKKNTILPSLVGI